MNLLNTFTPEQRIAAEGAARFAERQAIIAYIRKRADSALSLAKRGRFSEAEGQRLHRWLGALADDLDAQLHDDEPQDE